MFIHSGGIKVELKLKLKLILILLIIPFSIFSNSLPSIHLEWKELKKDYYIHSIKSGRWGDLRVFYNKKFEQKKNPLYFKISRLKKLSFSVIDKKLKDLNKPAENKRLVLLYESQEKNKRSKVYLLKGFTISNSVRTYLSIYEAGGIVVYSRITFDITTSEMTQRKWIEIWKSLKVIKSGKPLMQLKKSKLKNHFVRSKTQFVLLVASQAIDEYPLWVSKDQIVYNKMGKWYSADLRKLHSYSSILYNRPIAVIDYVNLRPYNISYIAPLKKKQKYGQREITLPNGTKIKLKIIGMSTALIVQKKNKKPEVIFRTGMGNCHSLSVSPDNNYVAFISELVGVIIYKIK